MIDEDRLNDLIYVDTRQTTRALAEDMRCDHSTIVWHLQLMGKVQKFGSWVPHTSPAWQRQPPRRKAHQRRHRRARLGGSSASALISGPCAIWLPPFPLSTEQSQWNFLLRHRALKLDGLIFCGQTSGFLQAWDRKTGRTLGTGGELWGIIHNWLVCQIRLEKIEIFKMQKNGTKLCTNPI